MVRRPVSLLAGSVALFGALTASAQTPMPESRPERPYRGVYASGTEESAQVLTVNGSAGPGYDTSPARAAAESNLPGIAVPYSTQGSLYNQFSGGLSYSAQLDRFSLGASLSSTARLYPQLDSTTTTSHALSSGFGVNLGKNTRITGAGAATYSSMRGFTPFVDLGDPALGQVAAPSLDYGTGRTAYYTYDVNTGLTQQLSKRSSLTLNYDRRASQFGNGLEDLTYQTGSFRFTRSLSRYLGLRLGYGITDARYRLNAASYRSDNLDIGVDYNRALSRSRRTRISFSTGASSVRQDDSRRYDVIGSARLTREIGRTWNAELVYQRNVGFLDAVREPALYDGINFGITGLITRRLSFASSAGATRGAIGVTSRPSNGFDAWTGSAGLHTALTRHLALGVNYTFYRYNFEQGAALVTGLLPETNRHSVNVTLSAWAPVFQHGKRRNASR